MASDRESSSPPFPLGASGAKSPQVRPARRWRLALAIAAGAVACAVLGWGVWWHRAHDPALLFEQADACYKSRRFDEAWGVLERLERLRPPTPVDRFLRAAVLLGSNRTDEGLRELAAVPDDHPYAPLARLTTGQAEIRRFRARYAEEAFLRSLELFPRGVQPRKELVYIYNIQHRQAELDVQLTALLDQDALGFDQVLHWTKTRNTTWNAAGDLEALEKMVAADAGDRMSRLALAEALLRLSRWGEADAVLAPLAESDALARVLRIESLMEQGDLAGAERLLDQAPLAGSKLSRLAGALALKRRDFAAAIRRYRAAYEAEPIDRATLYGLGTALKLSGRERESQPFLAAASRHDALSDLVSRASLHGKGNEKNAELQRKLGLACLAVGRSREARAWFTLAIRLDPADAESQRALFDLKRSGQPGVPDRAVAESIR